MKAAAAHLATAALAFALGRGDGFAFVGVVCAAMFGGLLVLIVMGTDLAVRVSRRPR